MLRAILEVNVIKTLVFKTLVLWVFQFIWNSSASAEVSVQIVDVEQGVSPLSDPWEFYPGKLLNPHMLSQDKTHKVMMVDHNKIWSALDSDFAGEYKGTYRTVLQLPKNTYYSLYLRNITTAYRVYLNERTFDNGFVDDDFSKVVNSRVTRILHGFSGESGRVEVVIQVVCKNYKTAGIWRPILVGSPESITTEHLKLVTIDAIVVGALALIGVYHFTIFYYRRKNLAPLFFGLFCVLVAIRSMQTSSTKIMMLLFPETSWDLSFRLEYAGYFLGVGSIMLFISKIFPKDTPRIYNGIAYGIFGFSIVTLSTLKFIDVTKILPYFQGLTLLCTSAGTFIIIRALIKKRPEARLFIFGFLIQIFGVVNDHLIAMGLVTGVPLSPYTLVIFIFVQSSLLAIQFSNAYVGLEKAEKRISAMNQVLEEKVKEKTARIRSILETIKQGILTFGADRKIEPDHSSYLSVVTSQSDFTDGDVIEKVFRSSSLSSDQREQIKNVFSVVLNEPDFCFEANEGALVSGIYYPDSKRHLELDWTPMIDEEQIVRKILLTLRDVTKEKTLQAKNKDQEAEIFFIRGILNQKGAYLSGFFKSSKTLLAAIDEELEKTPFQDGWSVTKRNLHTIKGMARQVDLLDIANETHEIESSLMATPFNVEEFSLSLGSLTSEIEKMKDIYQRVSNIGGNHEANIDLDSYEAIVDHVRSNKDNEDSWLFANLLQFSSRNIQMILSAQIDELTFVSKELGINVPKVLIDGHDNLIPTVQHENLKYAFGHLFRNSLSHSIEKEQERKQNGKDPVGTIKVDVSQRDSLTVISLRDDGRGLNLKKIKEEVSDLGLETTEDYCNSIFEPGFSTADSVDQISGRGIGMDAVKAYLEEINGSISVIPDGIENEDGFLKFHFEIVLPLIEERKSA